MYILLLLFRNNIILIISLIINQLIILLLLCICIYHLGLVKWMIWTRQWSKKPSIAVIKNPMMHLVKLESRQISSNRDISICFDSNTCICAILPLMFSLFCFCILETPNLRDSRVLCRPKWRETWTQSVQARLRWTCACVSQNTDHSTIVRNYHEQYQEDSLYLSALINSQPTWYKRTWQSLFHQPSRCRCLLPLQCLHGARFETPVELLFKTNGSLSTGMWSGRWNCVDWSIMTSHASLSLRSEIGDSIRWHMIRGGGKTNTIPQRPQPACLLHDWITLAWHRSLRDKVTIVCHTETIRFSRGARGACRVNIERPSSCKHTNGYKGRQKKLGLEYIFYD